MKGLEEPEMDPKSRDLLVQQASQCLSKLVQIASRTKRNFILDQVFFRHSKETQFYRRTKDEKFSIHLICQNCSESKWGTFVERDQIKEQNSLPDYNQVVVCCRCTAF